MNRHEHYELSKELSQLAELAFLLSSLSYFFSYPEIDNGLWGNLTRLTVGHLKCTFEMFTKRSYQMYRERVLSFVQARRNLSRLLDEISAKREAVIIAKRDIPVAAILGMDHYNELRNTRKRLSRSGTKRVLKLGGVAEPLGDLDQAIRDLRKSRRAVMVRLPKK